MNTIQIQQAKEIISLLTNQLSVPAKTLFKYYMDYVQKEAYIGLAITGPILIILLSLLLCLIKRVIKNDLTDDEKTAAIFGCISILILLSIDFIFGSTYLLKLLSPQASAINEILSHLR